jgi:hypothetical protein
MTRVLEFSTFVEIDLVLHLCTSLILCKVLCWSHSKATSFEKLSIMEIQLSHN